MEANQFVLLAVETSLEAILAPTPMGGADAHRPAMPGGILIGHFESVGQAMDRGHGTAGVKQKADFGVAQAFGHLCHFRT